MSIGRTLRRRSLFVATIAGAALWLLGRLPPSWAAGQRNDPAAATRLLLSLLKDPRKARAIGRAYLKTLPDGPITAEQLAAAILPDHRLDDPGLGAAAALGPQVLTRIRRDFSEGAVVVVDGWVLSVTEARLYALAALASAAPAAAA